MKNLLNAIAFTVLTAACSRAPQPVVVAKTAVNADSVGMADALHQFFKWYGAEEEALGKKMDFINTSGKHPTMDLNLLAKYLGEYKKSGAVCEEFVQNETIFYRACSLAWENEQAGDVLTGFEVDRYYCQQDVELSEFLQAGVTYALDDKDRATVQLMLNPNGPNGGPRSFEMKKENGHWLLSKVLCDAAVVH